MGRGVRRRQLNRANALVRRRGTAANKTVVVPDVHGEWELLRDLLLAAGAIDEQLERVPGIRVVGVGDLVHGTLASEERDMKTLEQATRWLDSSLLGNHEAALLGMTEFDGVWRGGPVVSAVRSLCFRGFFTPALLEGQTLLTHAGVAPEFAGATAEETYELIQAAWMSDQHSPLFGAISSSKRTDYPDETGGILWLDWDEARSRDFSQIVGHSPRAEAELQEHGEIFHLNVDAGSRAGRRLTAALLEDGEPVELVTFERPEEA